MVACKHAYECVFRAPPERMVLYIWQGTLANLSTWREEGGKLFSWKQDVLLAQCPLPTASLVCQVHHRIARADTEGRVSLHVRCVNGHVFSITDAFPSPHAV